MTPKQREAIRGGKRLQQQRQRTESRTQRPKSGGRREVPERKGSKRRLFQLIVSGMILIVVVGVKFISPQTMEQYRDDILRLMGEKTDFVSVFSAVGKAVGSGAVSNALDEAYTAVFGSDKVVEEETNQKTSEQKQEKKQKDAENSTDKKQEKSEEKEDVERVVYTNKNLPEKVELFQQVLGFTCTNPVEGEISSEFGLRKHPIKGDNRFHYGIDIAAKKGTTIGSFAAGTVTAVGDSSELGKYVTVAHDNSYVTLYAHCSKILASSGQRVKIGDPIAEVGQIGDATGPHLHFELHKESVYLNPIYYVAY